MRRAFDTSVLTAAMVLSHKEHARAASALERVTSGMDAGVIAAHSLAELYSVLTRLPVRPRIAPNAAIRLIKENILKNFEVVALTREDYINVLDHLAANGIAGGAVFDALIMSAAAKAAVDQIVTLNPRGYAPGVSCTGEQSRGTMSIIRPAPSLRLPAQDVRRG